MKKIITRLFLSFSTVALCLGHVGASDILEKVIQPSKEYEQIIDLGNNKTAVGNEVFREWTTIDIDLQQWVTATQKEPLIVRITKWLLRITIAISITMVIIIGIRFIMAWIKWSGFQQAIQDMTNLIIGLILALSSVSIIWLIQSFTLNSLTGEPANLDQVTEATN